MSGQKTGQYEKENEHNFRGLKGELNYGVFSSEYSEPAFDNIINKIIAIDFPVIPDRKNNGDCYNSREQKIQC